MLQGVTSALGLSVSLRLCFADSTGLTAEMAKLQAARWKKGQDLVTCPFLNDRGRLGNNGLFLPWVEIFSSAEIPLMWKQWDLEGR